MDTTTSFVAVVLLLVANGFFVAAEFALVKARPFRIQGLADTGSAAAKLTARIQSNLEAYLAACQLGITMASLGLGWVGEPAVAALLEPLFHSLGIPDSVLHTTAFVTGFLIFSSLHIVIGEQVPKTFAIRKAEPVAMWSAYPLHVAYMIVWPLNFLLNKTSRSVLSLFGVEEATHADVLSGDELRGLVVTSQEHGGIHHQKADMLRNLFDFDRRQVSRVMIPRNSVRVLDVNGDPEVNLAIIRDSQHSRFPVVDSQDGEAIVGVVLVKDIQHAVLTGQQEPWRNLRELARDPLIVPENQQAAVLFNDMRTRRAHMSLVIDEYGALIGIVTMEDLLEEIVGEIHDETDIEEAGREFVEIADNVWDVDGLISLNDLEKLTGLQPPDDLDINTVSGLFMSRLGRVPEINDELIERRFSLIVLSVEEHRVGKARVTRLRDEEPDGTPGSTDAGPEIDAGAVDPDPRQGQRRSGQPMAAKLRVYLASAALHHEPPGSG
ncbi:MAG: hemolysin family protein [Pseudomonadales bacterium]|jgi:CBS domain containing-hemolysin-like protein